MEDKYEPALTFHTHSGPPDLPLERSVYRSHCLTDSLKVCLPL